MKTSDKRAVDAVLGIMHQMVSADGGSVKLSDFDTAGSRLVVDYAKGKNDHCATCVLDDTSLRDFIVEALETRGVKLADVVVRS